MCFMKRGEWQGWIFVPKSLSWILEDLDTFYRVPIGFDKLGSFCHQCAAVYQKRKMKTLKLSGRVLARSQLFSPLVRGAVDFIMCFYIEAFKSSRTYILWYKPYDFVLCFRYNWKYWGSKYSPVKPKKTYCEAPSVVWDEDKTRDVLTKLSSLSVDKFWTCCKKCRHFLHSIEKYLEKLETNL